MEQIFTGKEIFVMPKSVTSPFDIVKRELDNIILQNGGSVTSYPGLQQHDIVFPLKMKISL
ncbi:hypothetical protein OUZ56_012551 [Daphnia magna]|uniref:Uncharacterized protein n=1 Tax=Daphnia magna TaxID=35525 RepID=A0ABQ9Z3C4_9CRUS|nr:hypothetical protein OUZ56_012551 [Daphnia magna]